MPAHSGLMLKIASWVKAHPGRTNAEICAQFGIDSRSGMLTYVRKRGLIHAAGPRGSQRYYADAEQAWANHERICADTAERRRLREKIAHRQDNLRKRARRQAQGRRVANTRQAEVCTVTLTPGMILSPQCRVTVAPPPRDRWAPDPGWVRVVTEDYMARRQATP